MSCQTCICLRASHLGPVTLLFFVVHACWQSELDLGKFLIDHLLCDEHAGQAFFRKYDVVYVIAHTKLHHIKHV